jgi:hypothetical protein
VVAPNAEEVIIMADSYLPIAVRAYTIRSRQDEDQEDEDLGDEDQAPPTGGTWRGGTWPQYALVIDTETTVDASQSLTFGSYRYLRLTETSGLIGATCVEEGLFHADNLSTRNPKAMAVLRRYVTNRPADVARNASSHLKLLTRQDFVHQVLYPAACKALATVVTFNFLFDGSRLAFDVRPARGRFQGGFSFLLWQYRNRHGVWREDKYRPRITVKSIDSKRAMKRFTVPWEVEPADLVTEDQSDEVVFGGTLLDLRQLAYALTNKGHSLESACKTFGVDYVKRKVQHGRITSEYVDYNREDVQATAKLYLKVIEEYAKCIPSV